jgi:hypothetical protein
VRCPGKGQPWDALPAASILSLFFVAARCGRVSPGRSGTNYCPAEYWRGYSFDKPNADAAERDDGDAWRRVLSGALNGIVESKSLLST